MGEAFKAPIQSDVVYTNDPNQDDWKNISRNTFLMAGPVEALLYTKVSLKEEKSVIGEAMLAEYTWYEISRSQWR